MKSPAGKGSILIVCFFTLVMLSAFALTVGYMIRQKLQVIIRIDDRQKLRLSGEAGVKKSIYVLLKHRKGPKKFDVLNQSWSQNESEFKQIKIGSGIYSVCHSVEAYNSKSKKASIEQRYGISDEESKININQVKSPEVLTRLLMGTGGMTAKEADDLSRALMEWKTEGRNIVADGYYEDLNPSYTPRHAAFATLSELQWVKGMTPELYEKIRPYLTIYSSGQINLNTASRPVLLALGMEASVCDKLLAYRNWHDGLEGTSDDRAFEDLSSAAQVLANNSYLSDNEKSNFEALLGSVDWTVRSSHFNAQVLAQMPSKRQALKTTAVFDDQGVVKKWEEEFVISPL